MLNNTKMPSLGRLFLPAYLFILAASGLYASSFYSFILFHSLIEVICVIVLLTIFILAWNARNLLDNHYILFLGISFLSSASLELVHLFAYKGFGVFSGYDTNLPTQLWIAFRYMFSTSLLIAPVFITRRLNAVAVLTVYVILTALLFEAIFSGFFPDCYIEGQGLTSFKIYSEFIIILTLLAALGLLIRKRTLFDARVLKMLAFSIVSAIAADAAFTRYLSVYGQASLVGHFFLFLSAALIYQAIVVTGVKEPMAIIFRNLEQSEEHLRLIAETSVDLIFQLDVAGKVVFCSPAVTQYGYRVAEVIGKDFGAYIAREDLDFAAASFKRAIEGTHLRALELRLLTADGTPYFAEINIAPITANGAIIGLQGISRDVTARKDAEKKLQDNATELQAANSALNISRTAALNLMQDAVDARASVERTNEELNREIVEHKQAETALRASEQFNKAVLDTAGTLVVVLDMAGCIQGFNQACMAATGYTAAEVQGQVFWDLFVPDEELEGVRLIWEQLQAGDFPNSHENHWINKDGSRRLIDWTNTAIIQDAQMVYVISAGLDITDRKQAEEQIKASLAEKEVLLREVHHRVKNNLQVISSLISLQADSLTDERMRAVFSDVRDRVRAMALVHEKLYQTGHLAQLNFAEYAASLLQYLWRSHGALAEKVQLNFLIAPLVLPIETAVPCGLILNELAGNALKHAFANGNGGEVTVALQLDPATATVCLRVSDNGVGLPAGMDWRQSGSLGLRLVQILAGQLRGTLEMGTGPGAEFRVTFCLNGLPS
ncbi:MAG: PAS domain S-box protein [Chlorobium sp.]|nr:PAS domain S-box protein [Chlorobium sp.]